MVDTLENVQEKRIFFLLINLINDGFKLRNHSSMQKIKQERCTFQVRGFQKIHFAKIQYEYINAMLDQKRPLDF